MRNCGKGMSGAESQRGPDDFLKLFIHSIDGMASILDMHPYGGQL